jgi:hypothetical protein
VESEVVHDRGREAVAVGDGGRKVGAEHDGGRVTWVVPVVGATSGGAPTSM